MEPDDTSFADGDTHVVDRECPQCGEHSVTTYLHHDTFTYGSGDTAATLEVVDLPVRRCGACDFEFLAAGSKAGLTRRLKSASG